MSTPIISRELRQMVASVRREKTTGYITIKYQKLGRETQGLMQFVEGKLAYVSYGDDKNKDALERIKELTNPELSFGEGLSQGYLYTLDERNRTATVAPAEQAPPATQNFGRSTRTTHADTDMAASFVDTPEVDSAMPTMGAAVTAPTPMPSATISTGAMSMGTMRSGASDMQSGGQQGHQPRSINFEDHTGASGSVFTDNMVQGQPLGQVATSLGNGVQQATNATFNQAQQGLNQAQDSVRNVAGQAGQAVSAGVENVAQRGQQLADNASARVAGVAQAASMPRIPSVANQEDAANTTSRLANNDRVPWNKRLETTLMGTLIGLTLLTLLGLGLFDWWQFRRNAVAELEAKATTITEQLANHLSLPLFDVDSASVDNSIQVEMTEEALVAAQVIYAGNNQIFSGWQKNAQGDLVDTRVMPEAEGGLLISREQDINAPSGSSTTEALGTVRTFFSTESIATKTRRFLLTEVLRLFLLALVLILATYLFLRFALIGRILRLTKLANAISTGQSDAVIDVESSDELGLLAEAIKRMQASLQFAMRRLRR